MIDVINTERPVRDIKGAFLGYDYTVSRCCVFRRYATIFV